MNINKSINIPSFIYVENNMIIMNDKKSVNLTPENHEFIRKIAYNNRSNIQSELNFIISTERLLHYNHEEKILGYDELPKDFYNSLEWANARACVLRRDRVKCIHCDKPANHVDHLNSARFYPQIALDPNNLISSCEACHKKRHNITNKY